MAIESTSEKVASGKRLAQPRTGEGAGLQKDR